jgi:signal transduction histidine kinase/CheY-like chemotaxis protein/HPt (histidine-containing phosphotransfer) domain-containing protein
MITKYAQVLMVLIVFALMVVSSNYFVSETENRNLKRNAENAILFTEANIKSDMQGLETLLEVVSETISNMIINGESRDVINEYILFINNYVESDSGERLHGATGVFAAFDGQMLTGYESWIPPDDYYQTDRPWYTGAVKAEGEISITDPYLNIYSNEITITLSRQIFDRSGNALGIVCLNIELNRIAQYVVNTKFIEGGYGFLISENIMIIAHPNPDMMGLSFRDVKSGIAVLIDEFEQKGSISEFVTDDYRGIRCIVFVQRLQNGWYMGVATPRDSYFQSTRNLAVTLSALGLIFAVFLIWMLLRVSSEKEKSDERMKLMFNSTPLVAYIFNKDYKVIDCNQNAVTLFDLSSKQEFCDKFYDLMPEYQPDGRLTSDVGTEFTRKTLEEGYSRFEWTFRKFNGELIPCEIMSTRVVYKDDLTVVGYMRDLREQKKMLEEIQQRSRLLDTVNSAATVLLSNNAGTSFEASLLKSFELVGCCLDVDRVQIWRNEEIDGDMHFVLRNEWLSEYGKSCRSIPYGLHFPYSMKREWESKFLRGENINAPLSELPEEDRAFLGFYGMKSIVILPMFLDGDFWGFFSIDDCRKERIFSNEEISILVSAGFMMTSAVNRNIQAVKMREADERTQIMIDAAPLCAIFWDKNLKLVDCNQEAVNLFDLSSKQEFIERFLWMSPEYQPDGVLSKEKGPRLVSKAMEEGSSRFEWMHQKLDGELIPAEITCIRVKHRDEFTIIEYIRDLREQKAMIAEMRKAELAEESSKAKSDFLAKMSHEIRTPMNAILGITEIQLQDEALPFATKEALERIYNSGDLLLGIINDILDLSKIEAGKMVLIPAQYDIPSLIYDTVQLNMMRYESKPIEFKLDIDEKVPVMLIGDELRIKQILNNLLSNAFKYTNEGQVNLTITCVQDDKKSSNVTLVFCVSDTGQGMSAEQVRKLGSEYARFNMEANRKTEGTGLGMNITRSLVQMMNGSFSIESTPGMGSTFTVRLPQKRAGSSVIGKGLAENLMQLSPENASKIRIVQINREFMPYGRVLVVDDVETNLYVAKGLMAPYGLSIDMAMSGFEAVDKIRDGNVYDIIFMDHMMPRMDGIEATKIIRSLGYKKPIVALTANAIAGQAEVFLKSGFDDFISKPIDIRQLNMSLNKLIRDKKPLDVVEAARQQKDKLFSSENQSPVDPQLAEFFVRDAKKASSVLEAIYINKCRRSDDISVFIINVHSMKSALANIGEEALSAEASRLEQFGRDKDIKQILAELPSFLELLYKLIDRLEAKPEESDETADTYDNSFLKEKLFAIQAACASMNKKAAKEALAEIKKKTWPQSVKEQLGILAECLLHSEFDEVEKVISDFVKQL